MNSSTESTSPVPDAQATTLETLPPGLLRSVEAAGDRLVSKAAQLIQDKTTNMRSKMDGGKFYNRIQSGSFQVRCMATALRLQLGPDWVATTWQRQFDDPDEVMVQFGRSRKRKHEVDSARKVTGKYNRQRLAKRYQITEVTSRVTSQPDHTYGKNSAEPDLEPAALKTLCKEYLGRLTVTAQQSTDVAARTVLQAEDITGEWELQRKGRLTASNFAEVAKRRAAYAPLTTRFLYKFRGTKATRHGNQKEVARQAYAKYLVGKHPGVRVQKTGVHIDITHCWLAASPDGLVYDPTARYPNGLLEIKCPFKAEETPLLDLCTKPELKPCSFFL